MTADVRRVELDRWRAKRCADLEAENAALKAYRAQLERLLGLAVEVAASGTGVRPLTLLAVLEDLDRTVQEAGEAEQVAA